MLRRNQSNRVRLGHRERLPKTFLPRQMNLHNPDAIAAAAPMITVCGFCCKKSANCCREHAQQNLHPVRLRTP